jgi:23S rRNA (uracil1939-C5)-methyltransferase
LKRSDHTLTVRADIPAYGGYSIARDRGSVLFVSGSIPGETVEVRIDEQKKDYAFATAVKIIRPSPDRISPDCEVFGVCGGCSLQHVSYQRQISLKEEILLDSLRRIAKTDIQLASSLTDANPWHYRHRAQFKLDKQEIGFYKGKSRDVVDIRHCPLMIKEINDLFGKTSYLIKSSGRLFDCISEIHITHGNTGIGLLKVSEKSPARPDLPAIASTLLSAGYAGVCVETAGGKPIWFGEHRTFFELEGLKYAVSPQCFIQNHWRLNRVVVDLLRKHIRPLRPKRIVDLYSGAGNFSLPLSMDAEEIIAVEDCRQAIEDGKLNARLNSINNCRFLKLPVERFDIDRADVLIVDPPRPGLTNTVLNKILALNPERIVYVSCNPSTFARDLKKMHVNYELESIRLIDFFPQTYHIESIAFMKRR